MHMYMHTCMYVSVLQYIIAVQIRHVHNLTPLSYAYYHVCVCTVQLRVLSKLVPGDGQVHADTCSYVRRVDATHRTL